YSSFANFPPPFYASAIRFLAISKYSLSSSIPMKLRFRFLHATPVVPEHIQLSNIFSPSFVYVLIRYSNNATGFWVGCTLFVPSAVDSIIMDFGNLFPTHSPSTIFVFEL